MNTRYALMSLLLLAILPGVSPGAIPRTLSFQSVLASPTGVPKPDGTYIATFRLFGAAGGGAALWTEPGKSVTIAGGHGQFITVLGSPTSFGALTFDTQYFLEIQVSPDAAPMTPRIALQAAPYALSSGAANLTLPFTGSASVSSPGAALNVTNSGSGLGIQGTTNSSTSGAVAVQGIATSTGQVTGVYGVATAGTVGTGVAGVGSATGGYFQALNANGVGLYGIGGSSAFGVYADASSGGSAVRAVSVSGRAVWATCTGASYGAYIENTANGIAMNAVANTGIAVAGYSVGNNGVYGVSSASDGVIGYSAGAAKAGVAGVSNGASAGNGIYGRSDNGGSGVYGTSATGSGITGTSTSGIGVYGVSTNSEGVRGTSQNAIHGGVVGINTTNGIAIYGISTGGGYGGYFEGRVRVGVLEIAGGSDLAENFNVTEKAEPGTVMAIDVDNAGRLCVAKTAYSTTVAGVISGANNLNAGIILPDAGSVKDGLPLAMSGRVWVKCDASAGAIKPGDLLTTSDTPGHAMKAADRTRAPGATIGKAMTALADGKGLVLALVSLQ